MKLSIEISTYNRKDVLQMVLERLAQQTYPADRFEVVVASDGSTDGTAEMVANMKSILPYRLRFVSHDHRGPGPTHNLGIREAKGELVLMLADDILADPQLVEEHVATHEVHPDESVVVSGRLRQAANLPDTVFQRSWNVHTNMLFEDGNKSIQHGMFFVSNLSFKKSFVEDCGAFRDWPPASHEDLELWYRLRKKHMTLIHNPRALGYHYHPENLKSVSARSYLQGYNWHYFEDYVPDLWIRCRSGHLKLSDGKGLFLRTFAKGILRRLLINRLSIRWIIEPLIKVAEQKPGLAFYVPFLIAKAASYHFHRGIEDFTKKSSGASKLS